MEHITIGTKKNIGNIALVECQVDGSLERIGIKDTCFLLVILVKGDITISVARKSVVASAPTFLCFDESEDPVLVPSPKAQYICIYFHPKFLNMNMTFELLRSSRYGDIAATHDMFMLRPFVDRVYIVPIVDAQIEKIVYAAQSMSKELEEQRDWYWSCRCRSYFIEIIVALERMYGLVGYGMPYPKPNIPAVQHQNLRDALLYIEGHYNEYLTLSDISSSAGIHQATLTALMKKEFGCTAMEYLMRHRIVVSKKILAFTDVPIKEIAGRVGFKTVQHFSRVFKEYTQMTPAEYRRTALQNRRETLNYVHEQI